MASCSAFYILLTHAPRRAYHGTRRSAHEARPLRLLVVVVALRGARCSGREPARRADVRRPTAASSSRSAPSQIVLRALDGSVVSSRSSVRDARALNGVRVSLADIRPGFVATRRAQRRRARPRRSARSASRPPSTDRGVVTALRQDGDHAAHGRRRDGHRARSMQHPIPAPRRARRSEPRPAGSARRRHPSPRTRRRQVVNVLKRAGA